MKSPTINCPTLPPFAAADLPAVRRAFASAPACVLRQSWRTELESDFAPGTVRIGWRDETLLVFAELEDADIFSRATRPNQRLWELGDALEIFLRPVDQPAYSEFQVAPNNQQLQLRFASAEAAARARKSNSFDDKLIHPLTFTSRTWVRPGIGAWQALVEIPAASVRDGSGPLPGTKWSFSIGRYDYTRGRAEPVVSNSSALTQPDFHRLTEWGVLKFI